LTTHGFTGASGSAAEAPLDASNNDTETSELHNTRHGMMRLPQDPSAGSLADPSSRSSPFLRHGGNQFQGFVR
jgi:hypothetical protein